MIIRPDFGIDRLRHLTLARKAMRNAQRLKAVSDFLHVHLTE